MSHRSRRTARRAAGHRRLQAACSAAAFALLASSASAQFRASIQGTVTDSTGGVIPGATLTLTDTDTNRTFTATSNESGTYNFNALAPDHYKLTANAKGFQQNVIDNVPINPDEASAVNVTMSPGDVTTTVNVQGNTQPALDTETATISGNITSDQIQHLPSSGRDVFQLAQLAPGVFGDGARAAGGKANVSPGTQSGTSSGGDGIFDTENGPQVNSNGGQMETNGITIDGISTVSAVWGGASVITPTEDSVGNVKVISNQYDAENGRFSGANIQITSKTGTNDFHGSAFFRAQRPGLNAYQRYNGPNTYDYIGSDGSVLSPTARGLIRESTRANQIGGSIGGPIWKNHLFAFFAYETQRDNSSVPTNTWFETPEFRAASKANTIASIYNSYTGAAPAGATQIDQTCAAAGLIQGTNCAEIPGHGLDIGSPLTTALGTQDQTYASAASPGVGHGLDGVADIGFYQTVNPTARVGQQFNGRLDADVTTKDHLAFAIYWVPLSVTNFNGTDRTYNFYHHDQINDAYSGIWNHIFSASLLNEARFNDAGWRWNEIQTNPQEPFGLPQSSVTPFGNTQSTTPVIGSIQSQNLAFFGAPGPSDFNQHTYTYKDVMTKVAGNHSIKFGADLTRLYYLNNPTYSARPSYGFLNIWNFLNDAPWEESGSFLNATGTPGTNRQDTRVNLWGGFIQDAWKARPNLTLNFGVRYNYFGAYYSKENNLGVVQFGPTFASTYTGLSIRQGGSLTQPQTANVGPQFGFSYAPGALRNRMVVRGGYGLNFNQSEIAILGNGGSNPPYVFNAQFNNTTGNGRIDPRIVYGAPGGNSLFGYPPNPNAITTINSANLPVSGGIGVTAYQSRQPTIQTSHYSLDTEIDLGHQLVATVGYSGSVSRHLIVQSNLFVTAFANAQAFNPLVNSVDYYANTGNSSNNSLLVGLKHNLSRDFQFDAEFNYSKTMDTGSGPYYEDPYPYEPRLAYAKSDFNFGKALKIYGLWQPHLWHGNQLVAQALNGWSLSGIYNQHTGFPFTPVYNSPEQLYYAGSGYGQLRPASYNGGAGKIRSNDAYKQGRPNLNFPNAGPNQTYFTNPNNGVTTVGTGAAAVTTYALPQTPGVSRNTLTGPGYLDLDATITKSFGFHPGRYIGEHASLEFRADAFNFLNNTNLAPGSVDTNYQSSATFGQASQGLSGRTVNLQARFSF